MTNTPSETPPPAAIDELERYVVTMTFRLNDPGWKPNRASYEAARNKLRNAATELTRLKDRVVREYHRGICDQAKETERLLHSLRGTVPNGPSNFEDPGSPPIASMIIEMHDRATKAEAELAEAKREIERLKIFHEEAIKVDNEIMEQYEADKRALVEASSELLDNLAEGDFLSLSRLERFRTALQQHAAN